MMRRILLIALIAVVAALMLTSGCLQKSQKLGCCLKKNATDQDVCVLFNMTNDAIIDLSSKTKDCNTTSGYCNVSIGDNYTELPICSEDTLINCIKPNCTAMVCGDFTYKPRVAPGIASEDDFSETVPPQDEEEIVQGFYNAQCRFFPMDSKLKVRMKTSNAMINRFRFGIGSSFDEFDLYKNYFPMSDKYCAINPQGKVDRYVNYIGSDLKPFKAFEEIDDNCINDSNILAPFTFGNSTKYPTTILPEKSSYKFAEHYKWVQNATGLHTFGFFNPFKPDVTYKKLDKTWYRKSLATLYAKDFYDKAARAPFECNFQRSDCMSGVCKTDFYSRGVSVVTDKTGQEIEVPTDCNVGTGPDGKKWVFCMPTKSVSYGAGNNPPTVKYAKTTVRPWQFTLQPDRFGTEKLSDGTFKTDFLKPFDHIYYSQVGFSKKWYTIDTIPDTTRWAWKKEKDCPDHGGTGDTLVPCPPSMSGKKYPPAAQIAFFNRDDIKYTDEFGKSHKIIGYAVADKGEFEKTLFAKNCKLYEGMEVTFNYTSKEYFGTDEVGYCTGLCKSACGSGYSTLCNNFCSKKINLNQEPASPCKYTEQMVPNPNFVIVELDPGNWTETKAKWQNLTKAFDPIFQDRLTYLSSQKWKNGDNSDVVWSSMFWVPAYTGTAGKQSKGFYYYGGTHQKPYYISGAGVAYANDHNIYSYTSPNAVTPTAKALISGTLSGHPSRFPGYTYDSLMPRYIYLLKSRKIGGKEMIGRCEIQANVPKIRQYGWCEPCTLNTLALQKVKTQKNPYLPLMELNTETSKYTNLCKYQRQTNWTGSGFITAWFTNCFAPHISDIDDYNGIDPTFTGAPRTVPEATLIKERLEDYMKSGILPVLDLIDDSNWNLTSPYPTETTFKIILSGNPPVPTPVITTSYKFSEYDFKRLLGNSGAMVVVVDKVGSGITEQDRKRVLSRTNLVRSYCWRCLTAVHVLAPDNQTFKNNLKDLFLDPSLKRNVDVISIGYPTSAVGNIYNASMSDSEKAEAVVNDMALYGRIALKERGKPVLISQFFATKDAHWDDSNYEILFSKIIAQEDILVRAGIIGIIYTPVRATDVGIVDPKSGEKSAKFCALERATGLLGTTRSRAQFAKSKSLASVNCTRCTSLEIISGNCDTKCDNGVECTLPSGAEKSVHKCPDDTVIDTCQLCNATFGAFMCNKTFTNGTKITFAIESQYVNSDSYGDLIGGLKKPQKCCLKTTRGSNYTFTKKLVANVVNAPIVYPKSGDPNADCGMTTGSTLAATGSFCGAKLPVQDYDMECTFVKKSISEVSITFPEYTIMTPQTLIEPLIPFSQ